MPLRRLGPSIALALAAMYGCGDGLTLPGDATPSQIDIVTGNAQAGTAGSVLPLPLVVKVTDGLGRPVVGQGVTFTVTGGGGGVAPASLETDTAGRASSIWTLGPDAGPQGVEAKAVGGGAPADLLESFTATAVAGSGSLIAAVSGDDQSAPVNSALGDSLVVKVSDGNGNPVGGITITWTAQNGGSISPETVVTDDNGLAAAALVLGPTAGQQSAQAAGDALAGSPVTFVQTAVASNPTALALESGDAQTAPAGFEVAEDLVVKLTDDNGNGVGGRAVTWVVATGGGTVTPVNTTTDPTGLARTRWTLGSTAGANTLNAVFSGLPAVPFTATASNDVPSKVVLVSGDGQSAVGGAALANPLVVKVTDANDNPVQNVSVAWTAIGGGTVSSGGAPAASVTSATNAQGNAQVTRTLGTTLGAYTTTAEVAGLTGSPVTFTSTATVGPASQLVITTQPGGPVANGALLSPQPVVQMRDAGGNNVASPTRTVTAQLLSPPAGAALNGDKTKTTDGGGQAVFDDLNVTGPVGSYTIRFTTPSLTGVNSALVAITVGPVSAAKSTVAASPTSVKVGEVSTITATAKDAGGNAVQGVTVVLGASGNGPNTVGQPAGPTDANGVATGTFSSNGLGAHTITGSVGSTTFTGNASVNVTAGDPASIAIQAGNGQSATVGTAVGIDPAVIVKDVGGNPVLGVTVTFAAASGGGSVGGATPTTNGAGVATVGSWTLGSAPGPNTMTATIPGSGIAGNPVTFTATAAAGAPSASQSTLSVDQPTITAGGAGSTVTVTAKDGSGNLLTGVNVDFKADGGTFASASTNGSGVATATYSGTAAGPHTIGAVIGGVTINATAAVTVQAGAAANVNFTTQPPSTVSTNTAFTAAVTVTDAFDNPVNSATVGIVLNFVLGTPTLSGTLSVATDANGVATFSDLSVDTPGAYSLGASVGSITSPNSNDFGVF